jgi:glycosyltransferase involved in cell wall biosynthesis
MIQERLPELCAAGQVLILTYSYPPAPSGSSVLMHNLLSQFDPESYVVVAAQHSVPVAVDSRPQNRGYRIMRPISRSSRINRWWKDWQLPRAISWLSRLVDQLQPAVLVGVYPDYYFMAAACAVARERQIPWIAYFHDTMVETCSKSPWAVRAERLQKQVFHEAARVLVMSRGMADLFQSKYNQPCAALEHVYREEIPETPLERPVLRQAFWAGSVYGINARAVGRVAAALGKIDCPLLFATSTTRTELERRGIAGEHLQFGFFARRPEYLDVLQQQGLLVLALDWPDESFVHEDELATIFPTKTPEYLAAGRPILVHCPEHYFLARFFKEKGCGLVVSDRSVEALAEAGQYLLGKSSDIIRMKHSALRAARLFAADRVAASFGSEVAKAAQRQWGERAE